MNAYFFKMNQTERNNILDQHKSIYDGFVTQYAQNSNEQPLYVQDYANDKGGITVNNKGNVDVYRNMNINESDAFTGAKYLPDESFDFGGPDEEMDEYVSMGEQKDMIGDGPNDLEYGTFGDEDIEDGKQMMRKNFFDDEDFESEWDQDDIDIIDLEIFNEIEDEEIEPLQEQLNKTLDMFNRFKTYL